MKSIVAVLFFVATAFAVDKYKHPLPDHVLNIVNTPGKQYKLYLETTDSIHLDESDKGDAIIGLNVKKPEENVVDTEDLNVFYWHEKLKYAIVRFIKLFKGKEDKKLEKHELTDNFQKRHIRVALIECHYLLSKGLKQSCLADQLLTYASLVLGEEDVKSFFTHIGGVGNKLSKKKAETILLRNIINPDPRGTAEELGAYNGKDGVTLEEFTDYVTQETLNDDFRRCRDGKPNAETGEVKFKDACLLEELVKYTNYDLTEMDISVLYRAVDKDGDGKISKDEIRKIPGVAGEQDEDYLVNRIVKLLDRSPPKAPGNEVIDYGEFCTFMRTPTIQLQAQRRCTYPEAKQKDELDCLFDLFVYFVTTNHEAIWLVVPDLEQQIAFESFDTDNDGQLKQNELSFGKVNTKKRFFEELDYYKHNYVFLEEWNEYMDIPHMVYGTGDCLLKPQDDTGRGQCFSHEIEDIMENIIYFDDSFWRKWFTWYRSDDRNPVHITANDNIEIKTKCGSQDLKDLFLDELSMGDRTVTFFEFGWYVKQQELAARYADIVKQGKIEDIAQFNNVLMKYIENDITEYDVQLFFHELDVNHNHEIEEKDFDATTWEKVKDLIKKIDDLAPHRDADTTVNYREFWLWLNSEKVPGQKTPLVKDYFEDKCTKVISGKDQQTKEIECYVDHFKNHNAEIYK